MACVCVCVCVKPPQTKKPSMLACRLCNGGSRIDIPSDRDSLKQAAKKMDAILLWPEGRHGMLLEMHSSL